MAKAPLPGRVKTRLGVEPGQAARLQGAFLADTVAKVRDPGSLTVAGTPEEYLGLVKSLLPPAARLVAQVEGDLGERMRAATEGLFAESPEAVLILGTDAPTLPPRRLAEAAGALEGYEASIVPSRDGGYVLLGLKRPHEELFSNIEWSTNIVFRQTLERARDARVSLCVLDAWYDVDTPQDLKRLRAELKADPGLAPRTAQVLDVTSEKKVGGL